MSKKNQDFVTKSDLLSFKIGKMVTWIFVLISMDFLPISHFHKKFMLFCDENIAGIPKGQ